MLRKVLYLACMNSIQHNERIRVFYEHLITNNHKPAEEKRRLQGSKKPKVALVTCMKKFL